MHATKAAMCQATLGPAHFWSIEHNRMVEFIQAHSLVFRALGQSEFARWQSKNGSENREAVLLPSSAVQAVLHCLHWLEAVCVSACSRFVQRDVKKKLATCSTDGKEYLFSVHSMRHGFNHVHSAQPALSIIVQGSRSPILSRTTITDRYPICSNPSLKKNEDIVLNYSSVFIPVLKSYPMLEECGGRKKICCVGFACFVNEWCLEWRFARLKSGVHSHLSSACIRWKEHNSVASHSLSAHAPFIKHRIETASVT